MANVMSKKEQLAFCEEKFLRLGDAMGVVCRACKVSGTQKSCDTCCARVSFLKWKDDLDRRRADAQEPRYRLAYVTDRVGTLEPGRMDYARRHKAIGRIEDLDSLAVGDHLRFVFDEPTKDGYPTITTTRLLAISKDEKTVVATTRNSVYCFEEVAV